MIDELVEFLLNNVRFAVFPDDRLGISVYNLIMVLITRSVNPASSFIKQCQGSKYLLVCVYEEIQNC